MGEGGDDGDGDMCVCVCVMKRNDDDDHPRRTVNTKTIIMMKKKEKLLMNSRRKRWKVMIRKSKPTQNLLSKRKPFASMARLKPRKEAKKFKFADWRLVGKHDPQYI